MSNSPLDYFYNGLKCPSSVLNARDGVAETEYQERPDGQLEMETRRIGEMEKWRRDGYRIITASTGLLVFLLLLSYC